MEKVLVAGATGTTGKKVVELLHQSDIYEPIAMIRKDGQKSHFESKSINTVVADLEREVSHAVHGADKVIFAAGSGGEKVEAVDQEGAKKVIDAAKKQDVSKFVMLSAIGADAPEEASELKDYLHAKHNADEYLKASLLPYSIVRPGALTNNAGTGKIEAGKLGNKTGNISRDDVAKALFHSLNNEIARDHTFEILSGENEIEEALKNLN